MRSIQLLLVVALASAVGATDLSGTWVGTWEHQGESQGACLYLVQSDKGVQGQIAYRHDTRVSSIEAGLPVGEIVDLAIADKNQGMVNLGLKASETVSADLVLMGAATAGSQSESITLKKYTVPSTYNRYGKGGMEPSVIRRSTPEYTPRALAAKLQGTVETWVSIESSGMVGSDVTVLRGLGLGLDEEAVKCVKKWQFSPPQYDCNAEPVHVRI